MSDEELSDEVTADLAEHQNGVSDDAVSDGEDAVQGGPRRRRTVEETVADGEDADDLFGDEEADGDDTADGPAKRQLDDEELDSGDDEGRTDRVADEDAEQYEEREIIQMDMEIPRQAGPEPSDGEMYLLKVPDFLSIEPQAWQTTTYQPPVTDHHSKHPPSAMFSAFNTAMTTIHWRHSPSNPSELQSNARINRWSDGSLTLQLASDPSTQYEINGNPLAPPQRSPLKPTPTSINILGSQAGKQGGPDHEKYDPSKDAFTYLIMPVEQAEALRVARKVTAGLSIQQNEQGDDAAIIKLQAALANAANAIKVSGASGQLEVTEVDPELQRKRAEEAERQQIRDRKKRENAQERERLRADRALGRSGLSSARYGGLNVGMLEDDEMEGGGRDRTLSGKQRAKPRRRRNSEYSEDEDMGHKRFTREDSYDQEDDFVAASDEEEEVVEDDDDPDDGIVEEASEPAPRRDRQRPSAPAESSGLGDDADADGESDDDAPQQRAKRRRIIDEEEEE